MKLCDEHWAAICWGFVNAGEYAGMDDTQSGAQEFTYTDIAPAAGPQRAAYGIYRAAWRQGAPIFPPGCMLCPLCVIKHASSTRNQDKDWIDGAVAAEIALQKELTNIPKVEQNASNAVVDWS